MLTTVVLVLALSPLVYYLLCLCCVIGYFRRLRQRPSGKENFMPPASILKPVRGVDREAYENFASFCRLEYPEYEVVFAVGDAEDQVIPIIEKLRADFPQRPIRLITGVPRMGTNDKINNLCQLAKHAKCDLLVMSDSDVRVEPDYLKAVAAPFANPEIGAVTALYKSISAGNLLSDLNALGMYTDSAPAALVARKIEGKMQFAFGWTLATTKRHLAEIGGLEVIANYHSDDFELGKRIAERGHRVELMAKPVSMVFPRDTIQEYFHHELRWSIGLKNVRPLGYWGLILTHGLPWALLGAAVAFSIGSISLAICYLLAYLSLRIGLTWTTGKWGLGDSQLSRILWLVPLRDAITFVVWLAGFFSNEIIWRGLEYRVREGQLIPIFSSHRAPRSQPRAVSSVAN